MAAKPHAVYVNPFMGVVHWCPVRQVYIKNSDLPNPLQCRCGKRLKADKRGEVKHA